MDINVIYEDENLIVINKPAGLLVHSAPGREEETLVDWLGINFPEIQDVGDIPADKQVTVRRPGIVHRLDKDTSGIMLIARNQEYFEYLKGLFRDKKITKTYRAIIRGKLKEKEGTIDVPISIKSGTIKRTAHKGKDAKEAITDYRVLKEFENFSYIEAMPKTGRTHQIRVHLNSIGHPVVGDKLYGGKENASLANRQMLHAYSLEFSLNVSKSTKLVADLPLDFEEFLQTLEKETSLA
ncbi:MAG: RluA family pseudouridine synthase [Candidatus Colwellbacteria bacterium CG10_big_fil_rev_8_21_14_0_10_42_22]|uniref:Pseudouridine synthase n=1 Tax=Candidatus Colwellbacteria bacterium CG10_big_fil_rev_8_21_14_0_10_42_22 TaxID=1974540 RepID=A0A2H0VG15_9BACT|nr:MAG: RluA family pseudouridine synthase [Candidatus Colwellbacteria bacterium CG10_big_fil_rev_8_21_14_0_10_42_22]